MSRVALDLRMLVEPPDGVSRYSLELLRRVPALLPEHRIAAVGVPARVHRHAPEAEVLTARSRSPSLREQVGFPLLLERGRVDLFHATLFGAPAIGRTPYVLTLHDVIDLARPRIHGRRRWLYFKTAVRLFAHRARAIATVSEFSRKEIERYLGIPAERVEVVPNGIDPRFRRAPEDEVARVRERLGLPPEYLLYVGGFIPHKNVPFLLQAFSRVEDAPPLVLCGRFPERIRPEIRRLGLARRTVLLPGQGHDVLPALYSGATAFVFPSLYEGFGLPPLEAMACGTPTLVAYAGSLPEVTGGAALTFPLGDETELARSLRDVLGSRDLRDRLSLAGRARAALYRWEDCAERMAAIYRRALCG